MNFAQILGYLFTAAEFQNCASAGLVGWHAARNMGSRQFVDMEGNLAVKIALANSPAKGFPPLHHLRLRIYAWCCAGLRISATAPECRFHVSSSVVSCLLPLADNR